MNTWLLISSEVNIKLTISLERCLKVLQLLLLKTSFETPLGPASSNVTFFLIRTVFIVALNALVISIFSWFYEYCKPSMKDGLRLDWEPRIPVLGYVSISVSCFASRLSIPRNRDFRKNGPFWPKGPFFEQSSFVQSMERELSQKDLYWKNRRKLV